MLAHAVLARVASMVRVRAVLEGLELVQDGVAVEGADVARLRLRQPANRPREVHEVRLDRTRVSASRGLSSAAGRPQYWQR